YRRSEVQLLVEIHGNITSNRYEFSVSDNGSGMSSVELSRACEPFFRGKEVESKTGTGLGLSIVKRVIDACGGGMSVHSTVGRGITFRIRLPLVTSHTAG